MYEANIAKKMASSAVVNVSFLCVSSTFADDLCACMRVFVCVITSLYIVCVSSLNSVKYSVKHQKLVLNE